MRGQGIRHFPHDPIEDLRWLTRDQAIEGCNLYHLARTTFAALDTAYGMKFPHGQPTRYVRLRWAAEQLATKYSLNENAAYKDLATVLDQR